METFDKINENPKMIYLARAANEDNAGGFLSEEEFQRFKTLYSANPLLAIQRMNSAISMIRNDGAKKRYCEECVSLESAVEREIVGQKEMRCGIETETKNGIPSFLYDGFIDMGYFRNELKRTREKILVDKRKLKKHLADAKHMSILYPERNEMLLARMVSDRLEFSKKMTDINVEASGAGLMGIHEFVGDYGVCRHFAMLYQLFAQEAGIESRIVRGMLGKGNNAGLHAWNMAHKEKKAILVDSSGTYLRDNQDNTITRCIFVIEDLFEGRCYKKARGYGKHYGPHERSRNFYKYRKLE
ncbi:MAG: transglutaminase domain-containing protein [Candidatus Nanoarchaeia archaeon]|nr:transglutaminase domain-containing protein [Candidatus Nanoarchaeia archaeon]